MSCPFTAAQAARVLAGPQPLSTNFINGPYTPPPGVYFAGVYAQDASWIGEFFNLVKFRNAPSPPPPWYSATPEVDQQVRALGFLLPHSTAVFRLPYADTQVTIRVEELATFRIYVDRPRTWRLEVK